MKITNRYNLPKQVYDLLAKDYYNPGKDNYSVTELISPPQIVQLKRRHWDKLEEDVTDRFWSFFGHMAHMVMEKNTDSGTEKRLYAEVMGKTLSGQMDHHDNGVITDYKVTSIWTVTYGDRIPEWTDQLNCYAYLARVNGLIVTTLQIIVLLRDWSERSGMPPIQVIPIPLWSTGYAEVYVQQRMKYHLENETRADSELMPCMMEDTWEKPTTWAVMQRGKKRALRVLDGDEEAVNWCIGQGLAKYVGNYPDNSDNDLVFKKGYYIQERPGERTRCMSYCPVSGFCHQWRNYGFVRDETKTEAASETD